MKFPNSRLLCAFAGILAVMTAQTAVADDSEVFTSSAFTAGASVRPNVVFVIDTSGSMDSEVIIYDPTQTYTGSCDAGYVYWGTSNTSVPPDCSTTRKFTLAANRCRASYLGMQANGWWNGRSQQLNNGNPTAWVDLTAGVYDRKVECQSDNDVHGDVIASATDGGSNKRARNGSGTSRWGNSGSSNQVNWNFEPRYSFYSANYINYYYGGGTGARKTRLKIVQEVADTLIDNLQDVNLGLMRYSNNEGNSGNEYEAQGGMVIYPVSELVDWVRIDMKTKVDALKANGWTPLSETLFEAQQYLKGGDVKYGENSKLDASTPYPSVPASRTGGWSGSKVYESPMDYSCQKTFLVYLTDGLPTQDTQSNTDIQNLPDFKTDGYVSTGDGGGGDKCAATGPDGTANGACMVNLAGYMYNHDFRDDVAGKQNITTYIVGFGDDIAASKTYLDNIAKAGGGKAYTQSDAAGLAAALEEIFSDVRQNANTTFVSPTVAVNAFNRARNLNTLYVSVFAPSNREHWPGNLKKYQLINGELHGTNTVTPAVDPLTGFFAAGSTDMFNNSGTADGPDVKKGGAANRLPAWDSRKVYTYLGANVDLTASANKVLVANAAITNTMIGLSAASTRRQEVLEFTLGRDVNDENGNQNYNETRSAMGDPMHSRPAVAIYGGTEAAPQGTVYATTNDGMLHAFDMNDGQEKWAFIPTEMLTRLNSLQQDLVTPNRGYGLDGDVRLFKYDVNGNGVIEAGDKMYAVFGFARGGAAYYALDVTSPTSPRFLWKKTTAELPMLGQAWSPPVITRVNVNSNLQTDPQKFVAIFAAGYDTSQENYVYTDDGVGNGIYMLELKTGNLLWSAGKTGATGVNWSHAEMKSSIPSEIAVIDLNGDTYADRMYVGDMGGRIWRFDIWHGEAPNTLVSGGLLATLGAGHLASPTGRDARRFYYRPDVSVVTPRGSAPFMNIAIGSGYRGHPLETDIRDRFYAIRDYQPFNRRTNASYSSPWTPILDNALVDVTDSVNVAVPDGSNGWKIELKLDGWRGEKVLAESITVDNVIFFPTFTPTGVDPNNPCLAKVLNRTWGVYLDSAKPFGLRDGQVPPGGGSYDDDPRGRYIDNNQDGIAPGTSVIVSDGGGGGDTICMSGVTTHKCKDIGDITRTFWERRQ